MYYKVHKCTYGEMDITTVFGTVILGSNPGGCTNDTCRPERLISLSNAGMV